VYAFFRHRLGIIEPPAGLVNVVSHYLYITTRNHMSHGTHGDVPLRDRSRTPQRFRRYTISSDTIISEVQAVFTPTEIAQSFVITPYEGTAANLANQAHCLDKSATTLAIAITNRPHHTNHCLASIVYMTSNRSSDQVQQTK